MQREQNERTRLQPPVHAREIRETQPAQPLRRDPQRRPRRLHQRHARPRHERRARLELERHLRVQVARLEEDAQVERRAETGDDCVHAHRRADAEREDSEGRSSPYVATSGWSS
eukprot:31412-Pelagococcus_subviridis.AAC.18